MKEYLALDECQELVNDVLEILDCKDLIGKVPVSYSKRMTSTVGIADVGKNTIKISWKLFVLLPQHERYDTIVHEACHIVQYHKYGFRNNPAHGPIWQSLMILCGLDPEATLKDERLGENAAEIKALRKTRRKPVTCDCGKVYNVGPKIYKQISADNGGRRCTICKQTLYKRHCNG